MPAITIRNLSDSVHTALKQQAATEHLSVEALVRRILATETSLSKAKPFAEPRAENVTGFSEAPPLDLWGALRGTVRVPPGSDLTAPLEENWQANR